MISGSFFNFVLQVSFVILLLSIYVANLSIIWYGPLFLSTIAGILATLLPVQIYLYWRGAPKISFKCVIILQSGRDDPLAALLATLISMVYLSLICLIWHGSGTVSILAGTFITILGTLHYLVRRAQQIHTDQLLHKHVESSSLPFKEKRSKESFQSETYVCFYDKAVVVTCQDDSKVIVCSEPYEDEEWYRERPGWATDKLRKAYEHLRGDEHPRVVR